jgi:hypothetical protein
LTFIRGKVTPFIIQIFWPITRDDNEHKKTDCNGWGPFQQLLCVRPAKKLAPVNDLCAGTPGNGKNVRAMGGLESDMTTIAGARRPFFQEKNIAKL